MRQQLENMMDSYQLRASEQKQQDHFVVRDLESLSASALYTGPLGDSLGFGSIESGPEYDFTSHSFKYSEGKSKQKSYESKMLGLPSIHPVGDLKLEASQKGYKIFDTLKESPPLTRLDFKSHHGMPKMHLQHGKSDYFGRKGNEAADILAEIYKSNPKIKFPWEK